MSQLVLKNFTTLSNDEKEMVLQWRNHPSIRRWMYQKKPIAKEEHFNYIDSLKSRDDRCYFLVEKDKAPIGVIDFTALDKEKKSAEIGLYGVPSKQGVGKYLMDAILEYGFRQMHLKRLFANVYKENEKAIRLYQKYGFREINRDDELIYMEITNEYR